jgi:hypothetical protein
MVIGNFSLVTREKLKDNRAAGVGARAGWDRVAGGVDGWTEESAADFSDGLLLTCTATSHAFQSCPFH